MNDLDLWKFALAVVTTFVGAAWAAFVYFDRRRRGSAGDANKGTVLSVTQLPLGAVVLVLAGLALAGWAIQTGSNSGATTIDVTSGIGVGGDVQNSTVSVTGGD